MEENKIKAQKLFEKGMKFYNSQNYEEALKLFEKSQKLNYNNIVETFISQCKNNLKNNKNYNENFNKNYNENFSNKNFSNENKNFSNENKNFSNENKNFSNENKNNNNFNNENNKNDDEICTNLLKLKDYYEILKISKSASKDEIKRAYKKQAIKFHPDKNKSSKAEECFKKISEAYQILSNDEKRNFYDKFGTEEEFRQKYQSQHQNFEEEMDPFDIFDILFNGPEGFQRRRNFRRNNNYYQRENHNNNNVQRNKFAVFIQFLPLIFLLLVNILPDLLKSSPLYQFTNDSYYLNKRKTSKNNVVYFVGDKFLKKYPKIKDVFESGIENEIERNYLNYVAEKCEEVLHTKQILEYRIRLGYRYFQNELNRLDFRSCERYNDLRYKIR